MRSDPAPRDMTLVAGLRYGKGDSYHRPSMGLLGNVKL